MQTLALTSSVAWAITPVNCPAPQPAHKLMLTFDSDFAGSGEIDSRQWRRFAGQHGDGEAQAFLPEQVSAAGSIGLRIRTDRREAWNHPFASGEVTTEGLFSQAYGRFEMLAKMPQANGLWPAFWLMPTDNGWPPEIDVVEYIYAPWGQTPNPFLFRSSLPEAALHWRDWRGTSRAIGQGYHSPIKPPRTYADWNETPPPPGLGPDYKGYHYYSIDWRPGSLVWFIDGAPVFCVTDGPKTGRRVPNTAMYMIINDSVSSATEHSPGWAGYVARDQAFPLFLDVARVRVWKFNDIRSAPPPRLEVTNLQVSKERVRAGDAVTFAFDVRVGNSNLGAPANVAVNISPIDMTTYFGIGAPAASITLQTPILAARGRYFMKGDYTIPATLKPGVYAVGVTVGATHAGAKPVKTSNGASLLEGAVLTVRPSLEAQR